jgi:hypothetical protein
VWWDGRTSAEGGVETASKTRSIDIGDRFSGVGVSVIIPIGPYQEAKPMTEFQSQFERIIDIIDNADGFDRGTDRIVLARVLIAVAEAIKHNRRADDGALKVSIGPADEAVFQMMWQGSPLPKR